jgi:carboxypeptidase Taq
MPRTPEQAYAELIRRMKERALLASCESLLGWDERTYMPRGGASLRADQLGLLARLTHEMLTSPPMGMLLDEVESSTLVRDRDSDVAANVREIRRKYNRAVKLPKPLVEELARAATLGQQAWQEARAKSDFTAFYPHLQRLVELKREEAQAVGFKECAYDALLDDYEPGETAASISKTFAALRSELTPLIEAVVASGRRAPADILTREFPVDRQRIFAQAAAAAIGFDFDAGRLDVTAHPFCSGLGPGDVRLTTRYNPHHFNEAFFGTLHEAGHGIYEQGLPAEHFGTPLGEACSLGIHESQSRTWENAVGRSNAFWEHWFPRARQVFVEALRDVTLDDWIFAINEIQPSLIRIEADEATYNLHIILRFELEKALVGDELNPADLPDAWNQLVRKFLGLKPKDDAQGCLQDIHWSAGLFGYFPTYTLGNLYAAQFMEQARADLGDLDEAFCRGEFLSLKRWLNDKLHRHGKRHSAAELCLRVTGKPLSHEPLLRHLRAKCASLYGV